jgi:IS5 family transposase
MCPCTGNLPSSQSSSACRTRAPSCGFHRLEKHKLADQILATVNDLLIERGLLLKTGTVVNATLIAAPGLTKNNDNARAPEMHSSQKGNQWHFGMKVHIGADADSGLVHTVRARPAMLTTCSRATA